MGKVLTGSINMTKLFEASKNGDVSTFTAKNGDKFANVAIFLNDEPDKYGNDGTVKCQVPKDQEDKKIYIGNLKNQGSKPTGETTLTFAPEVPF